jgi:hypothetical protein
MDTPPIIWELDKTTDAFVAVFADHPKRLASVRLRVDGIYWNLHLYVIVLNERAWHPYTGPDKAKLHAERWLRLRYERIRDARERPDRPPAILVEPLRGDPFAPHPGGRKRAFKSLRR